MIRAEDLDKHGWYSENGNKNIWYYDSWEYEFRIVSQELYYINDGYGEPQLINKITNMEDLIETYWALEGQEMKIEE
jgi:hypothetical protein